MKPGVTLMMNDVRAHVWLRALTFPTLCAVITASFAAFGTMAVISTEAASKTPGSTYCFYGRCHRVKTLSETQRLVGKTVSLVSSHYDDCKKDRYNPCGLTSSGEPFFSKRADNAASPIYPDGTILLVRSPDTQQSAVIRINNAGPYWGNRKLDVSRALARKLGFEKRGVAKLETRILSAPTRAQARYKRNRRYDKVHGPIGKFASLDEAEKGVAVLLAFDAMTTAALGPAPGRVVTKTTAPFEVAALATDGRAFAAVRPELKAWPVVARQYARVTWPVVSPQTDRLFPNAVSSEIVVAAARPALQSWPVVGTRTKVLPSVARKLTRVAIAWPVVKARSVTKTTAASGKLGRVAARTAANTRVRKAPKRRTRVASLSRKRAANAQRRLTKKRRAASQKRQAKKRSGKKSASKARSKSKKAVNAQTRKSIAKTRTVAKPKVSPKPKPYVAVRQILHRNLGRGA